METDTKKAWYVIKTNGAANIRSINAALSSYPGLKPAFWLPGYMAPRKFKRATILRKSFLFYDYAFVELENPLEFERFLLDKGVSAYFLHKPGTKEPAPLTVEDIIRVKELETFKQLEADQFKTVKLRVGAYIEVVNGPFLGCKGTVLEITNTHAVLEMNVFERPTRVSISLDFLENLLEDCYDPDSLVDE